MSDKSAHLPEEREIALGLGDVATDLEYERDVLEDSVRHDYSTSEAGIVPLGRRRPLWHFMSLLLTFEAGFSFVLIGFTLHDAGYGLAATTGLLAAGAMVYFIYALFGAYLGTRTGQTFTLLTRSIFGTNGSMLVSVLFAVVAFGWVGFQANLTAQLFDGLYGWGHVLLIGLILAAVMVLNNLLGFTGISMFARYVVCPLLLLWIFYLVIKGFTTESSSFFTATPKDVAPLGVLASLALVYGFILWGNEPDVWRYGKPRFMWPAIAYAFALFPGFLLMGVGGWIVAQLSLNHSFGASVQETTNYSLFRALWLAWIIILVTQVAVNDGNYYASINAIQNLFGGWRKWRRVFSCTLAMCGAVLGAWIVPYKLNKGFVTLAAFAALVAPTVTTIMVVDHFLIPRLFGISRSLTKIPAWRQARAFNWAAVIALLVAMCFGAYASGLFAFVGENPNREWGLAAPEAWVLGGALYVVGVWVSTRLITDPRVALGFPRFLRKSDIEADKPIDIVSAAEDKRKPESSPTPVATV
jgi:purine-cytosine permease-like protein